MPPRRHELDDYARFLGRSGGVSLETCLDAFGISERTFFRRIDELRAEGYIIERPARTGIYKLRRPRGLEDPEAPPAIEERADVATPWTNRRPWVFNGRDHGVDEARAIVAGIAMNGLPALEIPALGPGAFAVEGPYQLKDWNFVMVLAWGRRERETSCSGAARQGSANAD